MIKPTVIFIMVITIAGHIYRKTNYKLYPKYEASEGYHTFLLAASTGMLLFVFSYIFVTDVSHYSFAKSIGAWFSSKLSILTPSVGQNFEIVNLISVLFFTIVFSWLVPKLKLFVASFREDSPLYNSWKAAARKDLTPEFTHLAFNSWEYGLPVALTLSNNKVYIGYISEIGIDSNDIHLLPILSGYRCDDTKDLVYLIDYSPVIRHILEEECTESNGTIDADLANEELDNDDSSSTIEPNDIYKKFAIAIPHREIIHANLHDTKYKKHFDRFRYDRSEVKAQTVKINSELIK
ncbi:MULTISPECIES: hypothetical protein [unclassified Pseudoalteromonas]|uniref:hypothetical protein n=1 Tax=unclassified Pseudoalteromonas TaxID=194690 RepID=UPI00110A3AC0|nr:MULTISPECIES: hypothetical protein [unclassified Pseudoalteromonas]TMP43737.1 hypothetical protein CWB80_16015 [Pseudoalteromonas sp. S1650]TMP68282.1 hypothetical protein CWB79_06310 [Pseudoalteromonas sp. S1649]